MSMSSTGSVQYSSIEQYLEELEKRRERETAPIAAIFLLGSDEMLSLSVSGHPWITRVRCELPMRPLGPGGEEDPVRASYIGACSADDPSRYETFVTAMRSIDITRCMHVNATAPAARGLAHLEQSDLIVIGDGPQVKEAWDLLVHGAVGLLERVKWRYYCGAVIVGIGTGAAFLGQRWWTGRPQDELESRDALAAGKADPHGGTPMCERYFGEKATEIVPCSFSTDSAQAEAMCELQGGSTTCITVPPKGAAIFNTDGALEPCATMLTEHAHDWKDKTVKTSMLCPPDEKGNMVACLAFLERMQAKKRAQRAALGLPPDAPLPGEDGDEGDEGDDDDDDEDDELLMAEEDEVKRLSTRRVHEEKNSWASQLKQRRQEEVKEEAEAERKKGVGLFKDKDFPAALAAFSSAAAKAHHDPRAHLNRSAVLLRLGRPRQAVLAADRALRLGADVEAKGWYRRASAWLAAGEFNEAIADLEEAKRLEPGDKAIIALRKEAEAARENGTWAFASDCRRLDKLDKLDARRDEQPTGEQGAGEQGAGEQGAGEGLDLSLIAARCMRAIETFDGQRLKLEGSSLRLEWAASKAMPEGRTTVIHPACLDQRALFCIEEVGTACVGVHVCVGLPRPAWARPRAGAGAWASARASCHSSSHTPTWPHTPTCMHRSASARASCHSSLMDAALVAGARPSSRVAHASRVTAARGSAPLHAHMHICVPMHICMPMHMCICMPMRMHAHAYACACICT